MTWPPKLSGTARGMSDDQIMKYAIRDPAAVERLAGWLGSRSDMSTDESRILATCTDALSLWGAVWDDETEDV